MRDHYRLSDNPFKSITPTDEDDLEMWVDREEQIEKWRRVIDDANKSSQRRNYLAFVIGNYGRGKTLSLLKIKQLAQATGEAFPIFFHFLSEEKSKAGIDFFFSIFRNIDFKRLAAGKSKKNINDALNTIPDDLSEPRTILRKIFLLDGSSAQYRLVGDSQGSPISPIVMDTNLQAMYFFRGEISPSSKVLKSLGVLRKIASVSIAKEYLAALLVFMKALGFKSLVMAVDESEYLFSLPPRGQRRIYVAMLRGLHDFPSGMPFRVPPLASMAIFLGISESGWDSFIEMEKEEEATGGPTMPLRKRIAGTTVLGRFDPKVTLLLIEKRLSYDRVGKQYRGLPLIPFDKTFVDFTYKATKGEPRDIIFLCDQVLTTGLSERAPLLTGEYAASVVQRRKL